MCLATVGSNINSENDSISVSGRHLLNVYCKPCKIVRDYWLGAVYVTTSRVNSLDDLIIDFKFKFSLS